MTVLTGADGFMRVDGRKVGKVRNFSLSIQRDAVDITAVSEYDREFIHGIRNTTGSCTLFYDPADQFANKFINSIFESHHQVHEVDFVLNKNGANANWNYVPKPGPGTTNPNMIGALRYKGILTNVSPSIDVGAAQSVQLSFQCSGPGEGVF